jgi:hypothetical protein
VEINSLSLMTTARNARAFTLSTTTLRLLDREDDGLGLPQGPPQKACGATAAGVVAASWAARRQADEHLGRLARSARRAAAVGAAGRGAGQGTDKAGGEETTAGSGPGPGGGGKVLRNPWGKGFENQPVSWGEPFGKSQRLPPAGRRREPVLEKRSGLPRQSEVSFS